MFYYLRQDCEIDLTKEVKNNSVIEKIKETFKNKNILSIAVNIKFKIASNIKISNARDMSVLVINGDGVFNIPFPIHGISRTDAIKEFKIIGYSTK